MCNICKARDRIWLAIKFIHGEIYMLVLAGPLRACCIMPETYKILNNSISNPIPSILYKIIDQE